MLAPSWLAHGGVVASLRDQRGAPSWAVRARPEKAKRGAVAEARRGATWRTCHVANMPLFRASLPVTGRDFLDREAALGRLELLTSELCEGAARWLAIVGPRKVGKTSLLWEVARRATRGDLRFVSIDVMDALPVSREFFRRYGACFGGS